MKSHVDVIVVGAGPVGLMTANILGILGVRALVAEKNVEMYSYPRAIGFDDEAMRALQYVGIAEGQSKDMMFSPTIEYLSASGYTRFQPPPDPQEYGHPLVATFLQPLLEAGLRRRLGDHRSIALAVGAELVAYTEGDVVTARLKDASGATYEVTAEYLLACDGAQSTVRRAAGIELDGETQEEHWLVIDAKDSPALRAAIDTKRLPASANPLVTISLPHDLRRFECRLPRGVRRTTDVTPALIEEMVRPVVGDTPVDVIRYSIYERYFRRATRFRRGRAFLLGDAAHLVPPYGGQGLCSGIRDAFNLAWKIAEVTQRRLGPALLDSYEVERMDHMERTIAFVKHLARRIEDNVDAGAVVPDELRESVEQRRAVKPTPDYPAGFFDRARSGGRMVVQPRVRDADTGATSLLDDVLGPRFAVLRRASCAIDAATWKRWLGPDTAVVDVEARPREPGVRQVAEVPSARGPLLPRHFPEDASFVVVRPDRFIYAVGVDADADAIAGSFARVPS